LCKGLSYVFEWLNEPKDHGGMFDGTVPELEMAIYSIFFMTRLSEDCAL
jgi:hypothetical protein